MAYAAVAALGAFSWKNIPIELLRDTQLPRLTVVAGWRGASPETVEAFLTSPLEAVVQQVKGVERIVSDSFDRERMGQAQLAVEFARGTYMDFARLELSERIAILEEHLPPGVGSVQVLPYVPEEFQDQSRPFLSYRLSGPYTLEALRAHVEEVIRPVLSEIEGVGVVQVMGGRARRLEVRLDPEASRGVRLDPVFLQQRIAELDLVREAGVVREGAREWTVTIVNRPASAGDILDAVVVTVGAKPVRVRDVAAISDTYEEATEYRRIDGRPVVTFAVIKEIGTNTVAVADLVKTRLAQLEPLAPYGAAYVLVDDESEEIRHQLSDLRARAAAAALVIFLVLLAFLRSFASAGTVFATIAFSVLISLNLIYFGGISLNLLTLMGLAMGFGLLVDNAIVVQENVFARRQRGEGAMLAAERGTSEVVLPILTSTATNIIVFVPFVYLQGELRIFYVPLAIVVVLSQPASLMVGFTFIPAVSAKLFTGRGHTGGAASGADGRAPLYTRFYAGLLGWTLRNPWVTVAITAALFAGSTWLFDRYVKRGVRWGGLGGERTYLQINVTLPRGSNLERTDELVRFFENRIATVPEVERFTAVVRPTFGTIEVTFPDSLETTVVPVAIKEKMVAYSHSFMAAQVRVYGYGPSFYGGGGSPPNYTVTVLGYNYKKVGDIAEDLGARLALMARIDEVDTNALGRFTCDKAMEQVVTVDRSALARYGASVEDLAYRLQAAVGGSSGVARLKLGGEEVEYQVKLAGSEDADVLALRGTLVQLPDGRRLRLGDVVTVVPRDVLANILRENQQYQRQVAYEFRGPVRLGDAVLEAMLART